MKKNKGLLITFIILTILVAAVAIVAALCTLFNPPLLTLPLPFEIPVIAVYIAAGLAVLFAIATILVGALSGKKNGKKKKKKASKKQEVEQEVEEVDEIVEKASIDEVEEIEEAPKAEEEVVEEISEEIEESSDEVVEEPEEENKEEAKEEDPQEVKEEEPAQEEVKEEPAQEEAPVAEEEKEEAPEEKEQLIAEENKKEHAAPAAVEEVVEEKAPQQKQENVEAVLDERFAEFMAAQLKLNQSMDKRLDGIDKTLKYIADMLKGLMFDAVPAGTTAVTVPIQETDEPLQAEEPAPQVEAQEEPTTDGGNYFEQVEEDKKIEDNNAQIAEDYAQEDDWIATADQELRIKPKMSFEMRLRVADEDIKRFYSDIKNELLSYGVHDRISRHRENFNQGRINICRMVINGKTLKVYLAVDPESIDKRYFHHTDCGHRKGLVELPTMINVRSKVSARKVKELITLMMESLVISKKEYTPEDFASQLTVDGFTTVECKGYDYLVQKSVTLDSVKEYPDNFAAQLIEMVEDNEYQERFIKTNLSIDDLAKNFKSGDVIDIDKVRELGLGPANSNFLSITEGKKLDKKFKVYANEFTPNAVKMVCLSGGEAFLVVQPEQTIEEV
ncbi:MAG: hypothetical protein K5923_05245 [Clostridia bacterium]|nr:hypothetical protein [Clostridia bacterium]